MSTGTAPQVASLETILRDSGITDPEKLLQLVVAETERLRAAQKTRDAPEISFTAEGLVPANFAGVWHLANMYARSGLIPAHFKGKVDDCAIAIDMARRLRMSAIAFMQNSYVVYGTPGLNAKVQIALVNERKVFKGPIRYAMEGEGMSRKCTAFAYDRETGERCEYTISVATAKAAGWWDKKDSLWPKMTDLFLHYRSAAWLIRVYCPQVVMGMLTSEELQDLPEGPRKPREGALTEMLNSMEGEEPSPEDAPETVQEGATEAPAEGSPTAFASEPQPDAEAIARMDQQVRDYRTVIVQYAEKRSDGDLEGLLVTIDGDDGLGADAKEVLRKEVGTARDSLKAPEKTAKARKPAPSLLDPGGAA